MKPTKPKVRAASKTAAATWFEWYTKTPRIWEVCDDRQYKYQPKQIVAYMKLFHPLGFSLDPTTRDTVENPANTAAEAIPTSTAVEATPTLTTSAKLDADDVAEEKRAAAVPAAKEKLSVAAIAVAEEKVTTTAIAVADVKVTTAASSADAAQPLADSGDDSSDDDVVWIPAPSGLPVTTGTGSVLNADDGRDDSEASETEWVPTENLAAPPSTAPQLYNIRTITNAYMRNGKRVYLVEWEQTEEPATSLPRNMVAAYNRRR
ncbi:hypothetical protein PF002_g10900 [Phytophthora fragariae]|uniref:Chromo domain-containing protein n=1 Tax=Phytophthora fragariae TaxID=53985 RepID=A0A6A3ZPK7_9STRA|nr:hypothetical protein PF002_g10900 [Phytophthora fragariae]